MDAPKACPGCEEIWEFRQEPAGAYRIACPTPNRHGRAAIFLNGKVGPPQFVLDRAGDAR